MVYPDEAKSQCSIKSRSGGFAGAGPRRVRRFSDCSCKVAGNLSWVLWDPINPSTGAPTIEPGRMGLLFAIKLIILGIALWLFVGAKRPFCRYVCPIGWFWSLFNKMDRSDARKLNVLMAWLGVTKGIISNE